MTNSIPMTATITLENGDFDEFIKHFLDDWQKRLLDEYTQLNERTEKLRRLLNMITVSEIVDKDESEFLGFSVNCPIHMLREQLDAMQKYRDILEMRMTLGGIPIPE